MKNRVSFPLINSLQTRDRTTVSVSRCHTTEYTDTVSLSLYGYCMCISQQMSTDTVSLTLRRYRVLSQCVCVVLQLYYLLAARPILSVASVSLCTSLSTLPSSPPSPTSGCRVELLHSSWWAHRKGPNATEHQWKIYQMVHPVSGVACGMLPLDK